MAYTQHIHLLLFFLALAACPGIQFVEGRQLKGMNKHELSPEKIETGLENHAKQAANFEQSLGYRKHNLKVSGQEKVLPATAPTTQTHEFSSSDVSRKDTFQSTTPGSSPGVGHSFVGKSHNMQPNPNEKDFTSVAGKTDGFQSTSLGHSPGIGHSFGNLKVRPNA